MTNPSTPLRSTAPKRPWTAPQVVPISRVEDAPQNFGFCADGQAGRGRRVLNCS